MINDLHNNINAKMLAEAYEKELLCGIAFLDPISLNPTSAYAYVVDITMDGISIVIFNELDAGNNDLYESKYSILYENILGVEFNPSVDPELLKKINDLIYNKSLIVQTPIKTDILKKYRYKSPFIKMTEKEFNKLMDQGMDGKIDMEIVDQNGNVLNESKQELKSDSKELSAQEVYQITKSDLEKINQTMEDLMEYNKLAEQEIDNLKNELESYIDTCEEQFFKIEKLKEYEQKYSDLIWSPFWKKLKWIFTQNL